MSRLAAVGQLMTAITKSTDQSAGASHPLEVGMLVDRRQSPESGEWMTIETGHRNILWAPQSPLPHLREHTEGKLVGLTEDGRRRPCASLEERPHGSLAVRSLGVSRRNHELVVDLTTRGAHSVTKAIGPILPDTRTRRVGLTSVDHRQATMTQTEQVLGNQPAASVIVDE